MILVDTPVWIDHLYKGVPELVVLLNAGEVLAHPLVIGELACGSIGNRGEVLSLLGALPSAAVAGNDEVLELIERKKLMGRGLGFIDAHLLASTALTLDARLWTRDRRLESIAKEQGACLYCWIVVRGSGLPTAETEDEYFPGPSGPSTAPTPTSSPWPTTRRKLASARAGC